MENTVSIGAGNQSQAKATIGRIVIYTHDEHSAKEAGGNVKLGTTCPAIFVRVWNDSCSNLKVFNDSGIDTWVTSVSQGTGPRSWQWPGRS